MPEAIERPDRPVDRITGTASVHTKQIEDACIDKDCIEELRVYLTTDSQTALNTAVSARAVGGELLHVTTTVKPISFQIGHYGVDLLFYYRICGEVMTGQVRPTQIEGLCVFGKHVVLCARRDRTKTFTSLEPQFDPDSYYAAGLPEAVIEAIDPIVLASQVIEPDGQTPEPPAPDVPESIQELFDSPLALEAAPRELFTTLGQFSTVRLERGTQLLLPVLEGFVPEKTCTDNDGEEEAPCEQFSRVEFPVELFYPDVRIPPCVQ